MLSLRKVEHIFMLMVSFFLKILAKYHNDQTAQSILDEALDDNKPFFLYLAPSAPHTTV
jgi:hypothetical protein